MIGWWAAAVALGIGVVVLAPLLAVQRRRAERVRRGLDRLRAQLTAAVSALRRAAAPIRARRTNTLSAGRR